MSKHTKFPVLDNIMENIIKNQVKDNQDAWEGLVVMSATPWTGTVSGTVPACRYNTQTKASRKNYKGKLCNATGIVSHRRIVCI